MSTSGIRRAAKSGRLARKTYREERGDLVGLGSMNTKAPEKPASHSNAPRRRSTNAAAAALSCGAWARLQRRAVAEIDIKCSR